MNITARGEIDAKVLNKNYKKLAVKYHPDKNRDDVEAAQLMTTGFPVLGQLGDSWAFPPARGKPATRCGI